MRWISSTMNRGDWGQIKPDQLPAWATIVPVISASCQSHCINLSGDQHASLLNLTFGNIHNDICWTPKQCAQILIVLILYHQEGVQNTDKMWHSAFGTVLSPLWNVERTGPSLTCNCDDEFLRQCYPLWAAWVGDYPEESIITKVLYGICPMCEIAKGVVMGHRTFGTLDNARNQHIDSHLLDEINIRILHTLGVHSIRNQFRQ